MKRDGQIILRLADNQRAEHPTSVACDYFARLVEERSNGRIHIITYHSSALGMKRLFCSKCVLAVSTWFEPLSL